MILTKQYDIIQECVKYAKQIKLHEPDPYYVRYCLGEYLRIVDVAVNCIFEAADIDFGLFAPRPVTRNSFADCISEKYNQDILASEFLRWYDIQYAGQWHSGVYPYMMKLTRHVYHHTRRAPKVKIMLRSTHRYKDDPTYDLDMPGLLTSDGKMRSKDALLVQLNRHLPIFLDVINHKRQAKDEPRVSAKQVVPSTFAVIDTFAAANVMRHHTGNNPARSLLSPTPRILHMEIGHAAELYTHVIQRMHYESATYIKNLITSSTAHTIL